MRFLQTKRTVKKSNRKSTSLRVDRLEDRCTPTANLFVDFGESLPSSGFTVTADQLRDTLANGGLQGPDLVGAKVSVPWGFESITASSKLEIRPFSGSITNFDYNGDGNTNSTDLSNMRADIVAQIASYYSPFDITVSSQSASSISAMNSQLSANNGLSTKKYDAYALVAGVYFSTTSGTSVTVSLGSGINAFGVATAPDLFAKANQRDDTVLVFADVIQSYYSNTYIKNAMSFVTSHEAGHAFGLRHTSHSTSDNALLTGSDIMTEGGTYVTQPTRNDIFFSRFDLPYAESWPDKATTGNSYLQLVNDPDIGTTTAFPASAYITGTGAHDKINVVSNLSGGINVSVTPYSDSTYSTQIGASYNYSFGSIPHFVRISSGSQDDDIRVGNSIMSESVVVSGGTGSDTVRTEGTTSSDTVNIFPQTSQLSTIHINSKTLYFDGTVDTIAFNSGQGGDDVVFAPVSTTVTTYVQKDGYSGTVILATYGTSSNDNVYLVPGTSTTKGYVDIGSTYRKVYFDQTVDQVNYDATHGGNDVAYVTPGTTNVFFLLRSSGSGSLLAATYGTNGNDVATLVAATSSQNGSVTISGGYKGVYIHNSVSQINFDGLDGNDTLYVDNTGSTQTVFYIGGLGLDILYYKSAWQSYVYINGVEGKYTW